MVHICRFCKAYCFNDDDTYRYGTRHWAHKTCYLERRGLTGLTRRQIEDAPFYDLKRLGLLAEVERILAQPTLKRCA